MLGEKMKLFKITIFVFIFLFSVNVYSVIDDEINLEKIEGKILKKEVVDGKLKSLHFISNRDIDLNSVKNISKIIQELNDCADYRYIGYVGTENGFYKKYYFRRYVGKTPSFYELLIIEVTENRFIQVEFNERSKTVFKKNRVKRIRYPEMFFNKIINNEFENRGEIIEKTNSLMFFNGYLTKNAYFDYIKNKDEDINVLCHVIKGKYLIEDKKEEIKFILVINTRNSEKIAFFKKINPIFGYSKFNVIDFLNFRNEK